MAASAARASDGAQHFAGEARVAVPRQQQLQRGGGAARQARAQREKVGELGRVLREEVVVVLGELERLPQVVHRPAQLQGAQLLALRLLAAPRRPHAAAEDAATATAAVTAATAAAVATAAAARDAAARLGRQREARQVVRALARLEHLREASGARAPAEALARRLPSQRRDLRRGAR